MASKTDIANLALNLLGEGIITSIDDTESNLARSIKTVFDHERDKLLERSRWRFAKSMTTLSKLAETPTYKWTAAYQLPSDFIKLIEVDRVDAWNPHEYLDVQAGKLYMFRTEDYETASDTVDIEYIKRVTDTTLYSPLFVDALAHAVAARVCRKLTGSDQKAGQLMEQLEKVILPEATKQNLSQVFTGKNHPIRTIIAGSLLHQARGSGGASNVGFDS